MCVYDIFYVARWTEIFFEGILMYDLGSNALRLAASMDLLVQVICVSVSAHLNAFNVHFSDGYNNRVWLFSLEG
jgi:hypothetical protein